MTIFAEYSYLFGAGTEANRKIEFKKDHDEHPTKIAATVYAKVNGEWEKVSDVNGDNINVEMMSTSEKMQTVLARYKGEDPPLIEQDKTLGHLGALDATTREKLLKIFKKLEPKGQWRVEITNSIGPKFEKIVKLNLFNPS